MLNINNELKILEESIKFLEVNSIFLKKNDLLNCYVDIQSGSGGIEAQDWANMLLRMYLKWADYKKFKTEIISKSEGDKIGIKSATFRVLGNYAFGWFRTESGIHRLVRKSPFDSNNRRHTSFSSIFVYPDLKESIHINIDFKELKIDVYKSSGAGGQHVNKTESAVRIKHLPTGVVVQCQSSRSQHTNKDYALKQLKAKLYELKYNEKQCKKKIIECAKSDIGWGNQIRSYTLDDSRIKDLRTGLTSNNVQSVLNGNLDYFVEASLKYGL